MTTTTMATTYFDDNFHHDDVSGAGIRMMVGTVHAFDQSIAQWNVSSVRFFDLMFYGSASFNQALDSWDVSSAPIR